MSHLELVRITQADQASYDILTSQHRYLDVSGMPVGDSPDFAIIHESYMNMDWYRDGDMPAWLTPTVERLLEVHSLPFTLAFEVESEDVCTLLGTVKWLDGQLSIEPIKEIGA